MEHEQESIHGVKECWANKCLLQEMTDHLSPETLKCLTAWSENSVTNRADASLKAKRAKVSWKKVNLLVKSWP